MGLWKQMFVSWFVYPQFLDDLLQDSELVIWKQLTTMDKLLSSSMLPSEKSLVKLEGGGGQKFWDEPPMNTQGIYPPNIPWLKTDGPYGLFEDQKKYKTAKGEIRARQLLKPLNTQGIYPPPPRPMAKMGLMDCLKTNRNTRWPKGR